jgi:hypothetical protein
VEINQYYQDNNLGFIRVDKNKGVIESQYLKPFVVFNAYATNKANLDFSKAYKLSNSEEKKVREMVDPYLKEIKLDGMPSPLTSKYYKGLVAYPLLNTASAIAASIENNLYAPQSNLITAKQNLELLQGSSLQSGSAYLLNSQNGN